MVRPHHQTRKGTAGRSYRSAGARAHWRNDFAWSVEVEVDRDSSAEPAGDGWAGELAERASADPSCSGLGRRDEALRESDGGGVQ